MKNDKLKKRVINVLIVFFVFALLISIGKVFIGENYGLYKMQAKRAVRTRKLNERIKEIESAPMNDDGTGSGSVPELTPEEKEEEKKEVQEFIDDMQGDYPDMVGWITVPNTNIDRAIVQGNDNEFYLTHDEYGRYEQIGSLFLDYEINLEEDPDNLIVYGHYIKEGYMFGHLHIYYDENTFRNNGPIRIETENGIDYYDVFAVVSFDLTNPEGYFNFNEYIYLNPEQKAEYANKLKEHSMFWKDVNIDENSKFLTLATCSYATDDSRTLIVGIKR